MPVELGGFEAEPADVLAILQTLAEADGSTGWCAATGVASNVAGGLLPEAGDGKDPFDQDRAAEQADEQQAHECHDRDRRVAERVLEDDGAQG